MAIRAWVLMDDLRRGLYHRRPAASARRQQATPLALRQEPVDRLGRHAVARVAQVEPAQEVERGRVSARASSRRDERRREVDHRDALPGPDLLEAPRGLLSLEGDARVARPPLEVGPERVVDLLGTGDDDQPEPRARGLDLVPKCAQEGGGETPGVLDVGEPSRAKISWPGSIPPTATWRAARNRRKAAFCQT